MHLTQYDPRAKEIPEEKIDKANLEFKQILGDPTISDIELQSNTHAIIARYLSKPDIISMPLTAQQEDEIAAEEEVIQDRWYLFSPLVQMTLPQTDPQSILYERTNGLSTLTWTSKEGVPFGIHARLLLLHASTTAVKTRNSAIVLGRSKNSLLKKLGLTRSGPVNKSIYSQLNKLQSSFISLEDKRQIPNKSKAISFKNNRIFEKGVLWWDNNFNEPAAYMVLAPEFYDALIESAVPFDFETLFKFKRSCMELDLFMYLSYRSRLGARSPIPWEGLYNQIGNSYKQIRQFKSEALKTLKKVSPHINGYNFIPIDRGLIIKKA